MDNWDFSHIELDVGRKKNLLAALFQIMILLMTTFTCYKFGGYMFKQVKGLGIGLRASAAIARLIM